MASQKFTGGFFDSLSVKCIVKFFLKEFDYIKHA